MLKTLAILAVLLTVTQTPVPATGIIANISSHNQHSQNEHAEDANGQKLPTHALRQEQASSSPQKNDTDKNEADREKTFKSVTNPTPSSVPWRFREWATWTANLVLAFAAIIGIIFGICTLRILNRQTKAARDAAIAARDSVQALVRAERAWISIHTDMPEFDPHQNPFVFDWRIENTGRSVATLIHTNARCLIWNGLDALPQVPQYKRDEIFLNGRILAPHGDSTFHGPIEEWENGVFRRRAQGGKMVAEGGGAHILVYGTVKYESLGEIHESNFIEEYECYERVPTKRGFTDRPNAPPAYSKHA